MTICLRMAKETNEWFIIFPDSAYKICDCNFCLQNSWFVMPTQHTANPKPLSEKNLHPTSDYYFSFPEIHNKSFTESSNYLLHSLLITLI